MADLRSIDMSTFLNGLKDPFIVDVVVVPNNELNKNVLGDGGEEIQEMSTWRLLTRQWERSLA